MKVKLVDHTKIETAARAIRKCYRNESQSKGDPKKDLALVNKVGNLLKHASTLEHLVYVFEISGLSRAALQELARHRIAGLTVESTRYTMNKLRKDLEVMDYRDIIEKYIFVPKLLNGKSEALFKKNAYASLRNVVNLMNNNWANDVAKYMLPECYKTNLSWVINARSLQNFLVLRTNPKALDEMRELGYNVYDSLPKEHRKIFDDAIYKEKKI